MVTSTHELEVSLLIVLEDMHPSLRTRMVNGCVNCSLRITWSHSTLSFLEIPTLGRKYLEGLPGWTTLVPAQNSSLPPGGIRVRKHVDVRVGSGEDHWLVVADVHFSIGEPRENRRKQSASIDRNLVHDQQRVLNFQNRLEQVVLRDELEIEPLCNALTADVANAAIDCFRKGHDAPRKDWISGHSWSLIKWAHSLRTDLRNARANFNSWRCTAAGNRDANEWTRAASTSWYIACRHAALALRQLEALSPRNDTA